jgi:3-hydroxy-9,10-secoandrosta-1,3,5(10)-triene-9,17-dione monooxygenase
MTTDEHGGINDARVTPDDVVAAVASLTPQLRQEQGESEQRGTYSHDIHERFLEGGVYHMLQPRTFGGLEFTLEAFVRVVAEIAKGDPSVAWSVALGCGRALMVGSAWPASAQRRVFGNPSGYFHAPQSVSGMQSFKVEPVDGGYRGSGTLPYCSGVPYSTHVVANALVDRGSGPVPVVVILEKNQYEVLPDWGGDAVLGHRASGSNSVAVDADLIPEDMVVPFDWLSDDRVAADVGVELHGSPMYLGRAIGASTGEMAAVAVGAARAALEEYELVARTKRSTGLFAARPIPGDPESALRYRDPNTQRDFGRAVALTDAAEAILLGAARSFQALVDGWHATGRRFTWPDDLRLSLLFGQAANLALEAVEVLFFTIGSSAIRKGDRLQRYFRDASAMRTHPTLWAPSGATRFGSEYFLSSSGPDLTRLPTL